MPSIEIQNLYFSFSAVRLFEGVSASLEGPAVVALLGPSGSGKTTLLRLIAGVLRPQGGNVRHDTHEADHVAWVPQDGSLFPWLTVEKNIAFPAMLAWNNPRLSTDEMNARAQKIAGDLGIGAVAQHFPVAISGGQKQRVAIGRALMAGAKILLMDEPFSALDPLMRMDVRRLVRRTTFENKMITVVATHDLFDAANIGDQVLLISGNKPVLLTQASLPLNPTVDERTPASVAEVVAQLGTMMTENHSPRSQAEGSI